MSQPFFDYDKARAAIENGPVLNTLDVIMGKNIITVEQIATIWHMKHGVPDYAFRVLMNGEQARDQWGDREFFHACLGFSRTLSGYKVIRMSRRPKWLPKSITLWGLDTALDTAIMDMTGRLDVIAAEDAVFQ